VYQLDQKCRDASPRAYGPGHAAAEIAAAR
jgi:hypothetical protein